MADLNYTVSVNTGAAQQNLSRLQNNIERTSQAFASMRNAVAGLAIGSFIAQSYQMANAISDAATAAGVTTRALLALQTVVQANGGSAEAAISGIGRFAQYIEEAASGSKAARDRFLDLGISLQELQTLSEEQLLARVIAEIGRMDSATQRLNTSVSIFGKQWRSVDIQGVSQGFTEAYKNAGQTADGVEAAGRASQNFSNAINQFRIQLLAALEPVSELANGVLENAEAVKYWIDKALKVGALIISFTAVGKVFTLIRTAVAGLSAGLSSLGTGVLTLYNGFKNFGTVMSGLGLSGITGAFKTFTTVLSGAVSWIISAVPALSQLYVGFLVFEQEVRDSINSLNQYINKIQDLVPGYRAVENAIASWLGTEQSATESLIISEKQRAQIFKETLDRVQQLATEDQQAAQQAFANAQAQAEARRRVTDMLREQRLQLEALVRGYAQEYDFSVRRYQLETQLIGASEQQRNISQERLNLEINYQQQINKLKEDYLKLSGSESATDRQQAEQVAGAMAQLTTEYQRQIGALQGLTDARTRATQAEQLNQFSIQSAIKLNKSLQDIQDDYAKNTLGTLERRYYDIESAARDSAQAAIQAEEARRGAPLDTAEVQKYYDTARRGIESVKAAAASQYQASRTFSAGWQKAFQEYAENATNAATRAQNIFQKFTQGMEDLIVNFAKTGKFEWKNFVSMMLEELLRAQIQATMANVLGTMGGGMRNTATAGMMGSMMAPQRQQSSGGGLLGGITSVIGGIGKAIGGLFGGSSQPSYEMGPEDYAGFFAKGGTLGAGKWGIAGEAGPEIVSGPATVTPIQPTQVTYNINAVDARSFQQLLASDPKFLYAVTEQGRRTIPGAR